MYYSDTIPINFFCNTEINLSHLTSFLIKSITMATTNDTTNNTPTIKTEYLKLYVKS